MATPGRLVEAAALVVEVPRFTPSQWQRLFWDAGLKGASVHLFLRAAVPGSPWSMVVDTGDGVVDLEAFHSPLPSAHYLDATVKGDEPEETVLAEASAHGARIEIFAVDRRCPPERAHELVARVASGVLRSTYGVAWLAAEILTSATAMVERMRTLPRGEIPLELFATVRRTARAPTVVIDTLGLPAWELPDIEIEVDADDADDAEAFVGRIAADLIARRRGLEDGAVFEGPLGLKWKAAFANASVAPIRAVARFGLAG